MTTRPARAARQGALAPFPSEAWLEAARRRWADHAFSGARAALDARSAGHHRRRPPIPDRQAGYYHDYFCPDHAVQLIYNPLEPAAHACPLDGRVFSGEPFDGARLWSVNDQLSDAALWLAFRAAMDPAAASAPGDRAVAREILLGYADRYPGLTSPTPRADGFDGIATLTALDESVWVIRLAWAFGLLGEALSAADRETVRARLFDRASAHLWRVRWPEIHNVSVWNASALIALAIVRQDNEALRRAVDEPLGLHDQLSRGVRADGLWWEVSLSYHYYTLAAAIWGVRTLQAIGRTVEDDGVLARMFRGPLALALPDLSLPAVNDCWYHIGLTGEVGHGIPDAAGFHEIGYGWTGDPALGWMVARGAAIRPRAALEGLLDGRPDLPASGQPPVFAIDHVRPSGLGVLRGGSLGRGDGDGGVEIVAILKAGPGARDHGHPDQLAIQLFGGGARLLDDLGTAGYGIPLNESWYRATASHSTIVIDGVSQPITDAHISHLIDEGDWSMAEGIVEWPADGPAGPGSTDSASPYAGVWARRQVALGDGYLVDVVEVTCDRPRSIDWVILPHGTPVSPGLGRPVTTRELGAGAGYEVMDDVRRLAGRTAHLRWRCPDGATLDAFLAPVVADDQEKRFTATGPANPASERVSVLVRRRVAATARFVAVLVPGRAGSSRAVRSVAWSATPGDADDDVEISVTTPTGVMTWVVGRGAPRRYRG